MDDAVLVRTPVFLFFFIACYINNNLSEGRTIKSWLLDLMRHVECTGQVMYSV